MFAFLAARRIRFHEWNWPWLCAAGGDYAVQHAIVLEGARAEMKPNGSFDAETDSYVRRQCECVTSSSSWRLAVAGARALLGWRLTQVHATCVAQSKLRSRSLELSRDGEEVEYAQAKMTDRPIVVGRHVSLSQHLNHIHGALGDRCPLSLVMPQRGPDCAATRFLIASPSRSRLSARRHR